MLLDKQGEVVVAMFLMEDYKIKVTITKRKEKKDHIARYIFTSVCLDKEDVKITGLSRLEATVQFDKVVREFLRCTC